jgi:hypothetical protein
MNADVYLDREAMFNELFKFHNLLGIFIGLAGLVFGVYSFVVSQPKYEISYSVRNKTVAELAGLGLTILDPSSNKVIDGDLCRTDVSFWVTGNTVIEEKVIRRPLAIVFPDTAKIVRAKIEAQIATSQLAIERSAQGLTLKFNYLDPGAGARVGILSLCPVVEASMTGSTIGDLSLVSKVDGRSYVYSILMYLVMGIGTLMVVIRLSDGLDTIIEQRVPRPSLVFPIQLFAFIVLFVLFMGTSIFISDRIDKTFFAIQVPAAIKSTT